MRTARRRLQEPAAYELTINERVLQTMLRIMPGVSSGQRVLPRMTVRGLDLPPGGGRESPSTSSTGCRAQVVVARAGRLHGTVMRGPYFFFTGALACLPPWL
jgi:hypothetical protein